MLFFKQACWLLILGGDLVAAGTTLLYKEVNTFPSKQRPINCYRESATRVLERNVIYLSVLEKQVGLGLNAAYITPACKHSLYEAVCELGNGTEDRFLDTERPPAVCRSYWRR